MFTVYSGGEQKIRNIPIEDEPDDLKIKKKPIEKFRWKGNKWWTRWSKDQKKRKLVKNSIEDEINDEQEVIEQKQLKIPSLKKDTIKINDESEVIKQKEKKIKILQLKIKMMMKITWLNKKDWTI